MVQQVYCSRRRLLRRGVEFHVIHRLSIEVPIRKKSLETYRMSLVYTLSQNFDPLYSQIYQAIYIYIYLGSSVSSTEKDIDTQLTKSWRAIDRLLVIWKSNLTDKMKHSFFQAAVVPILLYGCTTWTLTKHMYKKLDGNYTRMLRAILNKSWRQHPTKPPTVRPLTSHHENYPS